MSEYNQNEVSEKGSEIDIAAFLNFVLKHWYFLVLGIVIAFFASYLVHRYTLPTYVASGQVLLNVNRQEDPLAELTGQMGGGSFRNRFMNTDENDILVLKSENVSALANKLMPLPIRWYGEGRVRGLSEQNANDIPIEIEVDTSVFNLYNQLIALDIKGEEYTISLQGIDSLKEKLIKGRFFEKNALGLTLKNKVKEISKEVLLFKVLSFESSTADLRASMKVAPVESDGSVYRIQITHSVSAYSTSYTNALLTAFIEYSKNEKKQSYEEALLFVDARLKEMRDSLDKVERQLIKFRVQNKIINPVIKGERIFQQYYKYVEESVVLNNQLTYLNSIKEYLKGGDNIIDLKLPVVVGIENATLESTLAELKNLYTKIAQESVNIRMEDGSPMWEKYQKVIEENNKTLNEVVLQLTNELKTKISQTNEQARKLEVELGIFPEIEQQYANILGRYEINQNLYKFLSEKKLDIGIRGSTVLPDHKIIEKASNAEQVSPNKKKIYALGLSLGMFLPFALLFVFFYFDNKIKDINYVINYSKLTFIGVVPSFKGTRMGEIFESPKSLIAESFRNIKTKLRFSKAGGVESQVLLITSTRPGEGKTFCSENLASILAYGSESTVVIGTDMRRPQLFKDLNIRNEKGLSDYLSGQAMLKEVIHITQFPNLSVIVSGAIPPNPTELLDSQSMRELIDKLKQEYKYVILDTTPLDIVADANVLIDLADTVIIILRQGVTQKDAVEMLNQKLNTGQLPKNALVVLNDFNEKKSYSGYQNYGYGYGYKQAYV